MTFKKGDWVRTPRFCYVRLTAVFPDEKAARENGYVEPTHFIDPQYEILGKPIGTDRMLFAAYKKGINKECQRK